MASNYQRIKYVFLGNAGVGKTALCNRYVKKKFENVYQTTIGCSFHAKQYELGDKTYGLEIWDTAGQERYRSILPMYYRNTDIALICFDLTQSLSNIKENIDYWLNELNKYKDNQLRLSYIIGTKKDLMENIDINKKYINLKNYYLDNEIMLTSSKNNEGVEEIFDSTMKDLILKKNTRNIKSNIIDFDVKNMEMANQSRCC